MDRRAWKATVHRATKSQTQLKRLSMHACTSLKLHFPGFTLLILPAALFSYLLQTLQPPSCLRASQTLFSLSGWSPTFPHTPRYICSSCSSHNFHLPREILHDPSLAPCGRSPSREPRATRCSKLPTASSPKMEGCSATIPRQFA